MKRRTLNKLLTATLAILMMGTDFEDNASAFEKKLFGYAVKREEIKGLL